MPLPIWISPLGESLSTLAPGLESLEPPAWMFVCPFDASPTQHTNDQLVDAETPDATWQPSPSEMNGAYLAPLSHDAPVGPLTASTVLPVSDETSSTVSAVGALDILIHAQTVHDESDCVELGRSVAVDEPASAEPTRPVTNDGDSSSVAVNPLPRPSEALPSNGRWASSAVVETSHDDTDDEPGVVVVVPLGEGLPEARAP